MAKKTPEGEVKKQIKEVLDAAPFTFYFMPVGGLGQIVGISDFIGLSHGLFFAIEAKRDGKHRPTISQRVFLAAVRRARGAALVIHRDNLNVLEDWLNGVSVQIRRNHR